MTEERARLQELVKTWRERAKDYVRLSDANAIQHPSLASALLAEARLCHEHASQLIAACLAAEGEEEPPDYKARYFELLYAVARKFPGESRHETALRYIQQREQGSDQA